MENPAVSKDADHHFNLTPMPYDPRSTNLTIALGPLVTSNISFLDLIASSTFGTPRPVFSLRLDRLSPSAPASFRAVTILMKASSLETLSRLVATEETLG